jgi:hypothetical protein
MTADPALAAECERVETLQRLVRERLPREAPPLGLRGRIEASVELRRPRAQPSWRALAASIAVTAVLASGSTWLALAPEMTDPVRDGVVAAHIRSLMAPHPIDVASSDRHTAMRPDGEASRARADVSMGNGRQSRAQYASLFKPTRSGRSSHGIFDGVTARLERLDRPSPARRYRPVVDRERGAGGRKSSRWQS